jgi:lantibiotic leader peptide-processing serine protease
VRRITPLVLLGAAGFAACADQTTAPLSVETAVSFEESVFSASVFQEEIAPESYLVVMASQAVPADLADRIRSLGGDVVTSYDGLGIAVVQGLDSDAAAALQAADDIGFVMLDERIQLLDPAEAGISMAGEPASHQSPTAAGFYPRQWNMRAIGAEAAWAAGHRGSPSVTVAILDTGLDYTYPDLAGRVDLARSKSFVSWAGETQLHNHFFAGMHEVIDMQGHGTHVGNTVVSNGHIVAGVTQEVTLIGVKVLNAAGSGSSADILAGIVYAADIGADVINMSLGGTFSKSANPGFVAVINRAITYANRKGVTMIVSAGNANLDLDRDGDGYKTYCSSPLTVCVSATGPASAPTVNGPWQDIDARASYSNYGRSAIDVAAPGGNAGGAVWAACSKQRLGRTATGAWTWHTCSNPATRANNYVVGMNGTSMAAPHVAGLAALLVEQHGRNPGRISSLLHQSAADLGQPGTDPFYGKGRIDVARALGLENTERNGRNATR